MTIAGFPGIAEIIATELLDELQLTFDVKSAVPPSEKVPVAISCTGSVDPTETVGFAGEIVIETRDALTVISVDVVMVPSVAVIVVVPTPSAFTIPALPLALLTVATEGEDEVQMTDSRGDFELFRIPPLLL